MKFKQKFPCGYEIEFESNLLDRGEFGFDELRGCPLHGKSCTGK